MAGYIKGTTAAGEMAAIKAAFSRAVVAIHAAPDADQAFRDLSALGDLGRQINMEAADARASLAATVLDSNALTITQLATQLGMSRSRAHQLVTTGRERGLTVTDPGTDPEPAQVTAAIITSRLGVLIERRRDGIPPWTFPAGEMRAGESPAETITRRVPEETGVDVIPDHVIGRRIHPKTGRVMIYMQASAVGTDVHVGDQADLAEVRWATIAETRELMPDMFPPVRAYLDQHASD
jgi:8-oxo-dGTP diphosphatase